MIDAELLLATRREMQGVWQNIKSGDRYMVLDVAIDCTNERDGQFVVLYVYYRHTSAVFIRELEEFKAKFTKGE